MKNTKIRKTSTEKQQFFADLKEQCAQETTFSVIETAQEMGIPYGLVQEWTDKNKKLKSVLDQCRAMCANNAQKASEETTVTDFSRYRMLQAYVYENDDEVKKECDLEAEKYRQEQKAIEDKKKLVEQREKDLRKKVVFAIAGRANDPAITTQNESNELDQLENKKELAIKDRVDKWQESKAKQSLGYTVKKNEARSTEEVNHYSSSFDNTNLTSEQKNNLELANIYAATGVSNEIGAHILSQAMSASFTGSNRDAAHVATTVQQALIAMNPTDIYEGILCSRLIVLHNQYMGYMSRASGIDQTPEGIDMNINRATKLMRIYNETFDNLNRHRRKGEQKVIVQHVNVNNGGQAVVAGLMGNEGVGGNNQKQGE